MLLLAPQFTLAAIPKRADARDVWVCEPYWALHTLPFGGTIGTTSPRRRAQLLALRPDVQFVEVRGNIDTRLKKLAAGQCDALVLAAAGLDRLKRAEVGPSALLPGRTLSRPGQGALAIETRTLVATLSTKPVTPISVSPLLSSTILIPASVSRPNASPSTP